MATATSEQPVTHLAATWLDPSVRKLIRQRAHWLSRRYGYTRSDTEDIEQELSLALLNRCRGLDAADPRRESHIKRALNSALKDLIRRKLAQKRAFYRQATSLSTLVADADGRSVPMAEMVSAEDLERRTNATSGSKDARLIREEVQAAIQSLPPAERKLCRQLLRSHATELPHSIPDQVLLKIRKHFQQAGLEAYVA